MAKTARRRLGFEILPLSEPAEIAAKQQPRRQPHELITEDRGKNTPVALIFHVPFFHLLGGYDCFEEWDAAEEKK